MSLVLNGVAIEARASDDFINATQMCKAGGKRFNDWRKLDSTKILIEEIKKDINTGVIDVKRGNSKKFTQGSWVHPDLAVPLAQWISPIFGLKVSRWVREWRSYSPENEQQYQQALSELVPSRNVLLEKEIQTKLQVALHAEIEVGTPVGQIDLLTDESIIEIKEISKWKHALGQVLSYGVFHPEKMKELYLFGAAEVDRELIAAVCGKFDVLVRFHAE